MSTTRRTAGVHSRQRPLGPNGEKICYNCGGPLPKARPFNCSSKCSKEWSYKTSPAILRAAVGRRDKGVCALCHVDTIALQREYVNLPRGTWDNPDPARAFFLEKHGVPHSRECGDWWDADHITPVIEGGGECGLDNYRTLCLPCHREVTKELRGRIASRNRLTKREKRDSERLLLAPLFDTVNSTDNEGTPEAKE